VREIDGAEVLTGVLSIECKDGEEVQTVCVNEAIFIGGIICSNT
jgi:hypothetical protein